MELNPNGASDAFLVLETLSKPRNIVQQVLNAFPDMSGCVD